MSDSVTTDPTTGLPTPPSVGQQQTPGTNPNQPASYQPSPAVDTTAGIVTQITGGNASNTVAAVQGAQKTDNSFYTDIAQAVQKVTSQIGAVFHAGVATGSSPQAIAGRVDQLAGEKANAIVQSGQAGANIVAQDALQKAAAATQTAKDAVLLGLDPNNPDAQAGMKAVRDNAAEVFKQTGALAGMRANGFFDNPAKYLIDRVINMPIAEGRARDALRDTQEASAAIGEQTKTLGNRSIVDNVLNSTDTISKAGELYKQALGAATAAGIEPLIQAQQIHIGAAELGVAQQNAATSRAQLAIAQAKLPGELLNQQNQARQADNVSGYYSVLKEAQIQQLQATAAERTAQQQKLVLQNTQNSEVLAGVNQTIKSFGGEGTVTDFARIPKSNLTPLLEMTNNLQQFGSIAQGPGQARDLILQSGIPLDKLPPGHVATLTHIDQIYKEELGKATLVPPGETRPKGVELQEQVQSAVRARIMNEQNQGISAKNSIFTMPSVGATIDSKWGTNNPIVQAMKPLTIDGNGQKINREMDGSLLMNTASQLIKEGKLTEGQAVSALKDIAFNTLNDVQTGGGFKRFGIPIQEKFPVSYSKAGVSIMTNTDNVDLYNSAQTLTKLRAQVAGSKASEYLKPFMSPTGSFLLNKIDSFTGTSP